MTTNTPDDQALCFFAPAFGSLRPDRGKATNRLFGRSLLILLLLATGCKTQTLFQSSFNSNHLGAPPSANQAIGSVNSSGGRVVVPHPGEKDNWVELITTYQEQSQPYLNCVLIPGSFPPPPPPPSCSITLLANLFISSGRGNGEADVVFNLDENQLICEVAFEPDDTVHVNTGPAVAPTPSLKFPRDKVFTIAISWHLTPSSTSFTIQLYGNGASGSNSESNFYSAYSPGGVLEPADYRRCSFFIASTTRGTFAFEVSDILVVYSTP